MRLSISRRYDNVPTDWDCYWTECEYCGQRYHQSEGRCDCFDYLEDCECGNSNWTEHYGKIICADCKTNLGNANSLKVI
jgi:hypothetical protein